MSYLVTLIKLAFWYSLKYLLLALRIITVVSIMLIPLVWAVASLYMISLTWITKGIILVALIFSTYLFIPILSRFLVEGTRTSQSVK